MLEAEMRKRFQLLEPSSLQVNVIVPIHRIETDYLPTISKQPPA